MDYVKLREEIDIDPLTRGYSGMDSQGVADDINTVYRTKDRESMTASEVMNAIDITEFNALTADDQDDIWDVLHIGGSLNPFGVEATMFVNKFGGGSNTVATLAGDRTNDVSRGLEIGIGEVRASDVDKALAMEII